MSITGSYHRTVVSAVQDYLRMSSMLLPGSAFQGSRTPARRARCSYPMPAARRFVRRDVTHRARQRRHRQARRTTALRRRRMLRQAA